MNTNLSLLRKLPQTSVYRQHRRSLVATLATTTPGTKRSRIDRKRFFQQHPLIALESSLSSPFAVSCRRQLSSSQDRGQQLQPPKPTTSSQDGNDNDGDSSFGYNPGGSSITNKDTILNDIDCALGVQKPPDIEVFLTEHVCNVSNKASTFVHLLLIRFGHVGIRYRTSDGVDRIMNINGDFQPRPRRRTRRKNHRPDGGHGHGHDHDHHQDHPHQPTMVNFVPPEEFIFGTDAELAQQGGVYNRPFVSVRVENVAPGATDALHAYYEALHKASCIQPLSTPSGENKNGGMDGVSSQNITNNGKNQGAVRFNLVDVNLSTLARLLPPPFDQIPLKIISFFQRRHEQVQQSRDIQNGQSSMHGDNNEKDKETPASSTRSRRSPSMFSGSFETAHRIGHDIDDAVKDVGHAYRDVREATYVSGNCSQWTSNGLVFCGLLRRPRIFPKAILIDLLEDEIFNGRTNNVNLVVYRQVDHAKKKTDWGGPYQFIRSAYVHPLRPIRNVWYSNPEEFAEIIVSVPDGTNEATVKTQTPTKQPKKIFLAISIANAVVPAAILVGLVDHVGPMGPISAAVWLGLNYWLY